MFSLQLKNLSKSYGNKVVLKDISLTYNSGILGIAGPNGSGKSTLLQCISGLQRPTSGSVLWEKNGSPLPRETIHNYLGFSGPYISLYNQLTLTENLHFLQKLRGKETQNNPDKTLSEVGLDGMGGKLYGNLSTGQQQRAKLAAALFHNPNVLLLDEPGANLDEQGRTLVTNIVQKRKTQQQLTIIASNNPDELALCDEIYSVE